MMGAPAVHAAADYPMCWGTVGWGSGDQNAYDMGTTANDGSILVNVTLFRGRDSSKRLDQSGIAQGQRLRCKLASNLLMLPLVGTRVAVALLQPSPYAPGGSLVVHCDSPNPHKFGSLKAGELGIGGSADQGRVFFKNDGSVQADGTEIVLGDGATDHVALAQKVDSDFASLISDMALTVTPAPSSLPQVVASLAALSTLLNALSLPSVASPLVKAK